MYKLRAVVCREATIKGDKNLKCLWHENGGVSHHVLSPTPMSGTDVNTSDDTTEEPCSRKLSYYGRLTTEKDRIRMPVSRIKKSDTHVDACIEMSWDRGSIPRISTKCVVGKRIVSSREVNPMASLFCFC